eukprot:1161544-Pelagomonas_calceolata.AAC.2
MEQVSMWGGRERCKEAPITSVDWVQRCSPPAGWNAHPQLDGAGEHVGREGEVQGGSNYICGLGEEMLTPSWTEQVSMWGGRKRCKEAPIASVDWVKRCSPPAGWSRKKGGTGTGKRELQGGSSQMGQICTS